MGIFDKSRAETAAKIERLRKERAEEIEAEAERVAALPPPYEFVKAEWGVPFCDFERTPDGFKVHFNRVSLGVRAGVNAAAMTPSNGLGQAIGGLLVIGVSGAVAAAQKSGAGTNIEVTRNAVIIDGKKLDRRHFSHFTIAKTWKGNANEGSHSVLGYRYGLRSFEFGGSWDEGEADEVASALNYHLRRTPIEDDEDQPSPELLRAWRPRDF